MININQYVIKIVYTNLGSQYTYITFMTEK